MCQRTGMKHQMHHLLKRRAVSAGVAVVSGGRGRRRDSQGTHITVVEVVTSGPLVVDHITLVVRKRMKEGIVIIDALPPVIIPGAVHQHPDGTAGHATVIVTDIAVHLPIDQTPVIGTGIATAGIAVDPVAILEAIPHSARSLTAQSQRCV